MAVVISLLIFILIFFLIWQLWPKRKKPALKEFPGTKSKKTLTQLLNTFIRRAGDYIGRVRWPFLREMRKEIKSQLLMVGSPEVWRPDDFLAIKILAAICLSLLIILLFGKINPLYILILAGLGFYLPGRMLKDRISRRHRTILRSLPNVLDLLTLSVEAGLDFGAALNKVIEKSKPSPLIDELFLMTQEMRVGKTRLDGLRDMAKRVNQPELSSTLSALVQATQLGTSLGPILRLQAEQMRLKRFQLAEKLAAEAPTKMLFPLLFFIFPSVFIILFGPITLQFMGGGFFR